VIGFAVVITVKGNYDSILLKRMQSALNYVIGWCQQGGLSIKTAKTIVIPFTRRRKLSLKNTVVSGVQIEFSKETKYLGVVLDSKLLWNSHTKRVKEKAIKALMVCRGIVRQRWGLRPGMMRWIYTKAVRPIMSYTAFLWWQKSEQKVQRLPSDHWSNKKCSYNCVGSHVRPAAFASFGKKGGSTVRI
jgi:hypothetical protein